MTEEDSKYLISLGELIFIKRKLLKLTQEQLSKKVGLTKTHISRIEKGQVATSIISLNRIAKELGVELTELLKGL